MIFGIGCDLVLNSRFLNWDDKKILRFFTEKEFAESKNLKNREEKLASKFAAKEAFSKALGISLFHLI